MQSAKNNDATEAVQLQSAGELLQAGLAHHRCGALHEAARCYSALLRTYPSHADALNLLGVVARQQGDLITAERLILQAIGQNPTVALYHHHLGKTYALQKRLQDAVQSYRRAVFLDQSDIESMRLLASLLGESGEWTEATGLYEELLQREPYKAEWMYRCGHGLKRQGRVSEALSVYRRATLLQPDSADAHFNLGKALFEAGQRSECLVCFQRVLEIQPGDAEAHNYLGQVRHERGEGGQALQFYLEALRLRPDYVEVLSNLGALMMEMNELESAEVLLRRAYQLAPGFKCASTNLGTLLSRRGRFVEAFETFRKVLLSDPQDPTALCSMGFALDALGDLEGARAAFELALKTEPNSALARFNLSSHFLLAGNFAEGWSCYERRWELRQFTGKPRTYAQPRWRNEDIAGTSVLLYAEQGFGDTLQFVRYALILVERGARVLLETQAPLVPLLCTLHPKVQVLARNDETAPDTDWHCPLLSLPYVLGTDLSNIPAAVPYVYPDEEKAKLWAEQNRTQTFRVGVVWSGNPGHARDRLRSIPFEEFSRLFLTPQVHFYSLQKGPAAKYAKDAGPNAGLLDLEPFLLDFTDTAAVITNLDLVITVDTAVGHLAGAMGKPVWILLAHAPDWRWLKERSDSPWYPTARLFRQGSPGSWADVLDRVKSALLIAASEARVGGNIRA